jgi:hypothetical protein
MTDQASQPEFPYLPQVTITTTLQRIADALPHHPDASREALADTMKGVVAAVVAMRPRDPTEMAMVARIIILQAVMVESLRRAKQPGLPEMLRSRSINQANAACRLEDTTIRRLTQRQLHAVVPPAVWQLALPEARPQAPYVAPEKGGARRAMAQVAEGPVAEGSVAEGPLNVAVAANERVAPVAAAPQVATAVARPVAEGRHERRRRERAERRMQAGARTVGAAIGARGDGGQQPVPGEPAARAAASTMAMAA